VSQDDSFSGGFQTRPVRRGSW